MRNLLEIFWLCLTLTAAGSALGQSVLGTGTFYKFSIPKHGVYKIDYNALKDIGVNPDDINPQNIRVFGNEGGMLPQSNSIARPSDLTEVAITVTGEEDGKFNASDFILFYAEGPDEVDFNLQEEIYAYTNNLYSNFNYYFLTISPQKGKRITSQAPLTGNFPIVSEYDDYAYHGLENTNPLAQLSNNGSGREWYGERFGITNDLQLDFNLSGIVPQSQIRIISDILGQTYGAASLKLSVNDTEILKQDIAVITATTYGVKGSDHTDTVTINESVISGASRNSLKVNYHFEKAEGYSQAFLDHLLISCKRQLALYGDQTIFLSVRSLSNSISTFQLASAEHFTVWDITNLYEPIYQTLTVNDGKTSFSTGTSSLKKFIAFNNNTPAPEFKGVVQPQNLRAKSTPNLLIVTHPLFLTEAKRLAAHRRTYSNWTVDVVTVQEIYNEFSSGRQDITAIRDFVKFLYEKTPATLKALLLFGKGSFDYKDRIPQNSNFVPTYESRNSIHPLETYSSDDFYCFLENNEGEWAEDPAQQHTLDIGVGRLPVTTLQQAKLIVDKIIKYDTDKTTFGYWRKEIAFVADDGSNSDKFTELHQEQANDLANQVSAESAGYDAKKLFMGIYKKKVQAGGELVPDLKNDIINRFKKGAIIINFTGHGNEEKWTDEDVFSDDEVEDMSNTLYPFLVTATCEFGRNDNPSVASTAELLVTREKGGAIGLVTTSRPVNATSNFELNTAFYEALLAKNSQGYPHLGEVFRQTKNASSNGVGNRNFILLGDPSLTLKLPQHHIRVTSIKTSKGSDTLKALSRVIIKGQVETVDAQPLTNFNGVVEFSLYDKQADFVTTGRNPIPFKFKNWHNTLFRGKATVRDGIFETEFIIPKNIAYNFAAGKLSIYASDVEKHSDAQGATTNFSVGGTETGYPVDSYPPMIEAFIGDTTFINGGTTQPDTWLVARFEDESGINISDYGFGNSLTAILDDSGHVFNLNEYYVADLDNFRKGSIRFPLNGLAPGRHHIILKASDVHNNLSSTRIEFIVTDGEQLVIESFANYPNPFTDKTTLYFTHNRIGDDLQTQLFIYNSTGHVIQQIEQPVYSSSYKVDLLEFTNNESSEKKLPAGIYFARLVIRSLSNGSKNEHVAKLIILK